MHVYTYTYVFNTYTTRATNSTRVKQTVCAYAHTYIYTFGRGMRAALRYAGVSAAEWQVLAENRVEWRRMVVELGLTDEEREALRERELA